MNINDHMYSPHEMTLHRRCTLVSKANRKSGEIEESQDSRKERGDGHEEGQVDRSVIRRGTQLGKRGNAHCRKYMSGEECKTWKRYIDVHTLKHCKSYIS